MDIALYYAPIACAMVPYITLTEAGTEFEVRPINMGKGQNMSPEYLKINPKHKVPMVVVDGKSLTENVAIQTWVARQFPAAKLLPADPWEQLQATSIMSWCASGIHPYLTRIFNPKNVVDVAGTQDSVKAKAMGPLVENFTIADNMLAGREFFFEHFTAPDAHFFWCTRRSSQLGVDITPFKNVTAHHERMKTRDSVRKLLDFEEGVLADFAKAG